MTMEATPRWGLPQLFAGQAQKEIFHNEALARIDMLLHGQAESADEGAPPSSPMPGQCWIVAGSATGEWAGQDGFVACWTEGGWRFAAPRAGLRLWVADREHSMFYDGDAWRDAPVREDGFYVGDLRVAGPRQGAIAAPSGGAAPDNEARSAIGSILAAMRSHGLIEP
jgi:hypothetical protein